MSPFHLDRTYDVFLLAGQSNAQGCQGDAAAYPADRDALDVSIPFYWTTPGHGSSEQQWKIMQPQPGFFEAGHFGPELGFARSLAREGRQPAIFKFTVGGVSLATVYRRPGAEGLYDEMVEAWQHASAQLQLAGLSYRVCGFIWIQGESDGETPEMAAAYEENLQVLLDDLLGRVLEQPELPTLLGVDEQHPYIVAQPTVVAAQQRLAHERNNTAFTSMRGLEKADETHLTPAGLVAHGERLAEDFLRLLGEDQA